MDEFDKKREVVKSLMQMLGKNAHDEVSNSMASHSAMPMEKMAEGGEVGSDHDDDVKGATDVTIVIPEGHGEMPMDGEMQDDMANSRLEAGGPGAALAKPEPTSQMEAMRGMSDGGPVEMPKDDECIEEQDMENNSSTPFESLMKRAKRMK